jgi:predicted ATP-grasp superfamily ATP-dependent carboligase
VTAGVTVLVTGGEHFGGLAAVRALAQAGYETWAAVTTESSYAAKSRFPVGRLLVPDPANGALPFVQALVDAAGRLQVDVVLPGTDVALTALAEHADLFPASVALGVCPPDTVKRATEKAVLSDLAAAAGIAVPPTQVIARDELDNLEALDLAFPAVVKMVRSDVADRRGTLVHAGAFYVKDAEELREVAGGLPGEAWLAQPFLEGDLVAVAGVASEGTVITAVHQVADRIWPTDCGGSSYGRTIAPDVARERTVRQLVAELGWTGIFQLQVLRSGAREFLIDFNPRFYGTLGLALAARVNLPQLWVELLLGETPEPAAGYKVGARYRAQLNDLRAMAVLARSGSWSAALRGLLPRPGTCHPVFAWNDPVPVLVGWGRVRRTAAAATFKVVGGRQLGGEVDKPA